MMRKMANKKSTSQESLSGECASTQDLWDEEEAQDPDGEETSEEEFWKKEGDDHSWTS